jgi:hypothetical protein
MLAAEFSAGVAVCSDLAGDEPNETSVKVNSPFFDDSMFAPAVSVVDEEHDTPPSVAATTTETAELTIVTHKVM